MRLEEEGKKNRFHQQQRHLVTNTRVSAVRLEEIERKVKGGKKKGRGAGKFIILSFLAGNFYSKICTPPPIHTFSTKKNSQLAPSLPENFYLRYETF